MKAIRSALYLGVFLGCLGVGGLQAAPVEALGSPTAAAPGSAIETVQYMPGSGFRYPKAGGAIVDWCAVWAHDCGWGGATQFCRARGFDRALSWDTFRPGHTFVIGSQQYCDGDVCKGFSFVRCG
jgi:hypothetical protein